jgi:hypothetical protein
MRRSLVQAWLSVLLLASAFADHAVAAGQTTITMDVDFGMDMVQPENITNIRAHDHWTIVLEEGGAINEGTTSDNGRDSRSYRSNKNWGKYSSALRSTDRRSGTCNLRTVSGGYNPSRRTFER